MSPLETSTEATSSETPAQRPGPIKGLSGTGVLLILIVAGLAIWFFGFRAKTVSMSTPYQAVLLSNGSAYFGRLEGLGTPYPVLRDVFYVQTVTDPQTKQGSNILVKRGKEWHAPDRMILNANMIVLVEPVGIGSRVAQLIAQAKSQ
jgi:hypothetical protein